MSKTMWAVGSTRDRSDWNAVDAASETAARVQYARDCGIEWPSDSIDAIRVPEWDRLGKVRPMHWLRAGLGAMCGWCGYETDASAGAVIYRGRVTCSLCREARPWRRTAVKCAAEQEAKG